jgi:uncharacterized protein YfaS (alpha-2-macroglobulin family)
MTDMATGEPVPGAKVKIYKDKYPGLVPNPEFLTEGITDAEGIVLFAGTEKLDQEWSLHDPDKYYDPLFVRIEKEEDIAILTLSNRYDSSHSIGSRMQLDLNRVHASGTTAQGVYRAGDKIQYKIYVRDQNIKSFIAAPKKGYSLVIIDPQGKEVFEEKDLVLSEFGALHGEFDVPKTAISGWYRFELSSPYYRWPLTPMEVLVSDFTPALFSLTTETNNKFYQPGDELRVTTNAKLHSGGPYGNASTRISATLEGQNFYYFFKSNEGIVRRFIFDNPNQSDEILIKSEGVLNKNGDLTSSLIVPESNTLFGELKIESAVMDDRGKYITKKLLQNIPQEICLLV